MKPPDIVHFFCDRLMARRALLATWWAMLESNQRHPACKAGALASELIARYPCPYPLSNASTSRAGCDHFSSAVNPACSKWPSPVSASLMPISRMTTNEMQSVSDQSLSGRSA